MLALLFLRYADLRFAEAQKALEGKSRRRGGLDRDEYHAMHVVYVPDKGPLRYEARTMYRPGAPRSFLEGTHSGGAA